MKTSTNGIASKDRDYECESDEKFLEEELQNQAIIKPPDGGFGWAVVAAAFVANAVVDGIGFTCGDLLLPLWMEQFGTNKAETALGPALLSGFYLLSGPIASALANKFGCNNLIVIGSLVSTVGFILAGLAPNLPLLCLTFGVIVGIGFGFIFLSSIVIVSQYFDNNRALATGIAVCGSGIGTMAFAYVNPIILDTFGGNWRHYCFFAAGVAFCVSFCRFLYKPLRPTESQVRKITKITTEFMESHKDISPEFIKADEDDEHILAGVNYERFNNRSQTLGSGMFSNRPCLSSIELHAKERHTKDLWSHQDLATAISREAIDDLNRPLSKVDLFYPGSLSNLAKRTSLAHSKNKLSASVANLEAKSHLMLSSAALNNEVEGVDNKNWRSGVKNALKGIIDVTLFKSVTFVIFAISGFLTFSCFFVPYIFLGQQAMSKGVSESQKGTIIMYLGLVNTIARVACGYLADLPSVDALQVSNIAITMGGLATMCIPFLTEYYMFALYTIPFALGAACFSALRSVICVDLFGIERLTSAFGVLLLFMGFAALCGPPFAGFLGDVTNNMDVSFYVMGALMAVSGIIGFPLKKIARWESSKNEKVHVDEETTLASELKPLKA
uniref:MFS domain-containing protein n=1 Tax=Rhabditophanes sp. KR3021 TaxID=114890 RepID=A0AC35TKQ9_9BILA